MKQTKANRQEITYTAFDKAASIWQGNLSDPEQIKTLDITYGPMQERVKSVYKLGGQIKKSKIFVGQALEIEETSGHNIRQLHYVHAGDGLCAIYVTDEEGEDGQMFYIHKDYLGSYETISDESGTAIEKLNFDPWGRRRSPANGSISEEASSFLFDRGFTGLEHLDEFGLINMNGRMYDPLLGRFLSPDPIISNPAQSQHYNRYSYVWNNPLKFVDPSGFNHAPFMNENFNYGALPRQGFIGPTSGNHWSDPYRSAEGNFYLMCGGDYITQFGAASYQAQYNAAMGNSTNSTSDFDREVYAIIAEIYNLRFTVYLPPNTNLLVYGKGDLGEIRKYKDGSYMFMNSTMNALPYRIPDSQTDDPYNVNVGEVQTFDSGMKLQYNLNDGVGVRSSASTTGYISYNGNEVTVSASVFHAEKHINYNYVANARLRVDGKEIGFYSLQRGPEAVLTNSQYNYIGNTTFEVPPTGNGSVEIYVGYWVDTGAGFFNGAYFNQTFTLGR